LAGGDAVLEAPYYPIVYIRGYAGTQNAVEATVATPYMGFNLGSSMIRQAPDRSTYSYMFESPVIRLGKDHGYRDVYERGDIIARGGSFPSRSIWVFRYYDQVSEEMSPDPDRPEMEAYAEQLGDFLDEVRGLICDTEDPQQTQENRDAFKVYLVAHSMGGLIARTYLQREMARRQSPVEVDKVFTYATPHSGIDLKILGNLLTAIPFNNAENFNRTRMREYLDLSSREIPVNSLDDRFPAERFFSLVGTNYRDYGVPQLAVGPMSDGLVRITNSYVEGSARAFVHKAHSGAFGIVNSEEGYQNLRRFLFGDHRVDLLLRIDKITYPPDVAKEADKGKDVDASYHLEVTAKVRGTRWDLHRRTVAEESAMFIESERIGSASPLTLMTGFLLLGARVNEEDESLGFSLDLGLRVPEYRVDGFLWMNNYYEGGYVLRDKFNFDLTPGSPPNLRYGRDTRTTNRATTSLDAERTDEGGWEFEIPLDDTSDPKLVGALIARSTPWNA
jgi:pimeloyl-ACP methyl ester carboxylesterase